MKRLILIAIVAALAMQGVAPASAGRRVVRRGPHGRTVVVVHRGWPLRRPLRTVVVRPPLVTVRVAPVVFLPVVMWTGVAVAAATAPPHDLLVWEDGATLSKDEEWTEFTLNCDTRGTRLWIEVAAGKAQFDWAEVVFENGEDRVVDMKEWTRGPGLYPLVDFRDGRKVDHVRGVARARSDTARVVLRMEK